MSSQPIKYNELDVSKLNHDKIKLKKNKDTGQETKQVKMTYNGMDFRFKTIKAKAPFGVTLAKEFEGVKSKYPKYYIEINVEDPGFKKSLVDIDETNITFITNSSKEWFGKALNIETVRDSTYSSLIKKDKMEQYPDRFKFKLPFYNGEPKFTVYNEKKEKIVFHKRNASGEIELDWSWAQKQMYVEAVVECEGLWVVSKQVYCTYKLVQLKIYPIDSVDVNYFEDDTVSDCVSELDGLTINPVVSEVAPDHDSVDDDTDGEESE